MKMSILFWMALLASSAQAASSAEIELAPVFLAGKRLFAWVEKINSVRPPHRPFQLTAVNPPVFPMERPARFSLSILKSEFSDWKKSAPKQMVAVLIARNEVPSEMILDEETFRLWGAKLNFLYDLSARFLSMAPNIKDFRAAKATDFRPFIFLKKDEDLEQKILALPAIPRTEKQKTLRKQLLHLCRLQDGSACEKNLNLAIQERRTKEFYQGYLPLWERVWNSQFILTNLRNDLQIQNGVLTAFVRPSQNQSLNEKFKAIVEEAWKGDNFRLEIQYRDDATISFRFEPGAMPHVDEEWNAIIMDERQNLNEPRVATYAQHEFGHILGFPDCYIEFYDDDEKAFINYQLDLSNLMCSKGGKVLPWHIEELRKNYETTP